MALIWIEGFEGLNTSGNSPNTQAALKYASTTLTNASLVTGRDGGLALRSANSTNTSVNFTTKAFASPQSTYYIGGAFQLNLVYGGTNSIIQLIDSATAQITLAINSSNQLLVYRGTTAGTLLGTSTYVIPLGAWQYIEIGVVIATSTGGSVTVKVNQVAVLTLSSINTQNTGNATASAVQFQITMPNSGTSYTLLDDIYICDGTTGLNNTFLGDNVVEAVKPNGAGNYANWTASSGANYTTQSDIPEDGDTSYVTTSTSATIDTYTHGSLARVNSSILGIQVNYCARTTDSTAYSIYPVVRSSGTDNVGSTAYAINITSYAIIGVVIPQNPVAAANWTPTTLNAAEIGMKLM